MRPEILFPAFRAITTLPGIGPRLGKLIEKLIGPRLVDLYWHKPSGLVDRSFAPKVADAPHGRIATLKVKIERHIKPRNTRLPYKIICGDESGELTLVFFHAREDWLKQSLPEGEERIVSGQVEDYQGAKQMTHPDRIATLAEADSIIGIEPIYPLTAGLTPKVLQKAIQGALATAPNLTEWLDPAFMQRQGWSPWRDSLMKLHQPATEADLFSDTPIRRRLAYDELLANQLALVLVRQANKRRPGRQLKGKGHLRAKVLAALPYALTGAQTQAMKEIESDLASDQRMLRLLQGDVGSGKTIVALLTLLIAVEAGFQGAMMAPTEILARQHLASLEAYAKAAGVRVALLTGRDKGKAREALLTELMEGKIDLLFGTHAIFQDEVQFKNLGLVVIDEQHRFGVHQRLSLSNKGTGVDILAMTATPIPRTLALTAYGDMEVSKLAEKPPGRQPIDTRIFSLDRLDEITHAIDRKLKDEARVYWVCPLVEESEIIDMAAAVERHRLLQQRFGDLVGLVHGQQKAAERDQAMADFKAGRTRILVATTVIEVGVDVPEATVIVIEHAERFGLAQLHQLRGRIGRGGRAGTCLLLYGQPFGETAKARLSIMRDTEDGFRIAEEDLRLRGAGELLGTRQSGLPEFRLADLTAHDDLLEIARDDVKLILARDPDLTSPRGQALRTLLYLFERDAAAKTLRSG